MPIITAIVSLSGSNTDGWVRIQQNPATKVTRCDDLHRGSPHPAGGSNITGNLHLSYSIVVGGLCRILFDLTILLLIPLSSLIVFVPADNQQRVSVIIILKKSIHLLPSISFACLALQPIERFFYEANVTSKCAFQFILSQTSECFSE